ncbi:probable methyltransferase-like protein 24 isoform X2 [Liolophura sinensis]|uniref:probable methyltransferase-like protein 24 isoform X2 n=1 Tax=Liolophura sinensis TaxID=3198878 RepID=UPI0031580120
MLNAVIKSMPPEPKNCPTGKGFLPDENTTSHLSDEMVNHLYHQYGTNIEILCHHMVRMGALGDGGWEVCDDEHVRPKHNCLVYSFGIAFDFSFDDMIARHYGCEVHAFDPSMGVSTTKRSENVTFYDLGVYGANVNQMKVIHPGWSLKTLKQIRQDLQHTERPIDVLKMDIESSEWSTLTTAIADGSLNNVRQFLIELHNTQDTRSSLQILKRLRNLGFRIFYAHKNPQCGKSEDVTPLRTTCHELQMIHIPSCLVK